MNITQNINTPYREKSVKKNNASLLDPLKCGGKIKNGNLDSGESQNNKNIFYYKS